MKKKFRVKKSIEFKKILDSRKLVGKNSSFSIYYSKNKFNHGRIGISVSKKVGNAVSRSTIRRQIRAMINKTRVLDKSYDLIIIVRKEYTDNSFEVNLNNLNSILTKLV